MSVFNSFGKSLLGLVVIILVIGLAAGATGANFNPWQNAADARKTDAETAYQQQINDLNLQLQEKDLEAQMQEIERQQELRDAATQQEIARQQALANVDIQHQKDLYNQELAALERKARLEETFQISITVVGGISVVVIAVAIAFAIIRFSHNQGQNTSVKPISKQPAGTTQQHSDPWNNPVYRQIRREIAKEKEREARHQKTTPMKNPIPSSNHKDARKYDELPRAE